MSSSTFLDPEGWTIRSWDPGPPVSPGTGIPDGAFQVGSILSITLDPGSDSYSLQWDTQRGNPASVSGLRLHLATLTGEDLNTYFGPREVQCDWKLTLKEPGILRGEIVAVTRAGGILKDQPDTGAGTFTATANPDPNVRP